MKQPSGLGLPAGDESREHFPAAKNPSAQHPANRLASVAFSRIVAGNNVRHTDA